MRTLYHNRSRCAEAIEAEVHAAYAPLETLLAEADYVVLACPLTDATHHLIDRDALRRMKPSACLVNIARGGVVDQEALQWALDADDGIATAGLDVSTPEPLPRDHPLLSHPRIVWTPHRGSATAATRRAMAQMTINNMRQALNGEPLSNEVH
jgi:phosphoglycerate dehydrogenase-like enzyme